MWTSSFTGWSTPLRSLVQGRDAVNKATLEQRLGEQRAERQEIEEELRRELARVKTELAIANDALESRRGNEDALRSRMDAAMEAEKEVE
jgi:nitrogen fixation/metabolism regulation signal transduction histidine kinase